MPKVIKGPELKTFKQFLKESKDQDQAFRERIRLFEHIRYRRIPRTNNSYRQDTGSTNKMTMRHSHVFAKQNGRGDQLYAVNWDGSGHDGSSGREIPASHADYFRSLGYAIPADNILECVDLDEIDVESYGLEIIVD